MKSVYNHTLEPQEFHDHEEHPLNPKTEILNREPQTLEGGTLSGRAPHHLSEAFSVLRLEQTNFTKKAETQTKR